MRDSSKVIWDCKRSVVVPAAHCTTLCFALLCPSSSTCTTNETKSTPAFRFQGFLNLLLCFFTRHASVSCSLSGWVRSVVGSQSAAHCWHMWKNWALQKITIEKKLEQSRWWTATGSEGTANILLWDTLHSMVNFVLGLLHPWLSTYKCQHKKNRETHHLRQQLALWPPAPMWLCVHCRLLRTPRLLACCLDIAVSPGVHRVL